VDALEVPHQPRGQNQ